MLQSLCTHLPLVRVLASTLLGVRRLRSDAPADFSDFLAPHFASRRDAIAVIGERSRFTWGELDAFASRIACWALDAGMRRGDIVALSMENRPEYVAIWLGLSRVGVVTALLNTNLTGERLAHCVGEASPRAWIVGVELMAAVSSALPHLASVPPIFAAELVGGADGAGNAATGPVSSGAQANALPTTAAAVESFDARLAATAIRPIPDEIQATRRGADLLFLIYTSGTTGMPKAARISHLKAALAGMAAWKSQQLGPGDRTYCCLPLYHTAGGVMAVGGVLMAGGSIAVARRFSASQFWSDCVRYEVTSFQYIGELCRYLVNSPEHPDERRHRIRTVLGNGLRPDVWEAFQTRFAIPRIVEFYGATEGNLALLNMTGRTGSVGQLPGFVRKRLGIELVRFDVEREEVERDAGGACIRCATDEAGELLIKISPQTRFEGYTNPAATEKKILRDAFVPGDAYFRTGDLLRMDADGFYYFVDRIGDTFRWKGENVATSEVGEVISVDPGVDEANVYGVAIPGQDGRAGMAALVVNERFDLERVARAIHDGLAPYARPLFLRILPQMEITGTFKHRKVDL
ncbi:long-chain-acyl-CoA synthetase, partial [Myxococcota bacterium]|nr:long-chain-acyl-CoA synthetase [Myxococcota bacterium]